MFKNFLNHIAVHPYMSSEVATWKRNVNKAIGKIILWQWTSRGLLDLEKIVFSIVKKFIW